MGIALLIAHWAFWKWAGDEFTGYEWAVLAGTGGVCTIIFVTWMVTRLQYERRQRDMWNASLNTSLLAAPGDAGGEGGGGRSDTNGRSGHADSSSGAGAV